MKSNIYIRAYCNIKNVADVVAVLSVRNNPAEAIVSFLQSIGKRAYAVSPMEDCLCLHVVTDDQKEVMVTDRDYLVLDYAKKLTVVKRNSFHVSHRRRLREDKSEFMIELQDAWKKARDSTTSTVSVTSIHPPKKNKRTARKKVKVKPAKAVTAALTLDPLTEAWTTFRDTLQTRINALEEKEILLDQVRSAIQQLANKE
jgi:hypothetical protein